MIGDGGGNCCYCDVAAKLAIPGMSGGKPSVHLPGMVERGILRILSGSHLGHLEQLVVNRNSVVACVLVCAAGSVASGQVISAGLLALQGDGAGDSTISSINAPFVDNAGGVGFVAGLANGERAIMRSTGGPAVVIWSSSLALPSVVTGGESTMGISASGGFIYSPSTDGRDSVHTHAGLLMAADDVAVGVPGRFITFCSRPRMTGNGTAYWVSGTAVSVGGASSGRVFYRSTNPADPLQTVALWVSGDAFAPGLTIGTSGVGFDYDCSENGEHRIHELLAAGASTATDECVWADGIVLAREGSPAPDGTNWGVFQGMGINNSGVTIFAADTSGPTTSDQVLVLNGSIVFREGESLAGRVPGFCGFGARHRQRWQRGLHLDDPSRDAVLSRRGRREHGAPDRGRPDRCERRFGL